jgi:CheY-like chemotaxis protein
MQPNSVRVLVVDDDESLRQLLALHLRNAGYEVFVAEDAVAGGHMVVERSPQVIVCDVAMPYMDGYEFVTALKADPETRAIPVIFLTVKDDVVEHAKQLGASYLMKPVLADQLLKLVAQAAQVKKA